MQLQPAGVPTRTEHDALGSVPVPGNRLWGARTERCRALFAIGDRVAFGWPRSVIRALGRIKVAAAQVNGALGEIPADIAGWIARAAAEVTSGDWDTEFPIGVFQTGSGTHTNMNANEVIANRANLLAGGELGVYRPVHPNDHVNRGQSSNDVFPAVMHLATLDGLDSVEAAVGDLRRTLADRAARWRDIPMLGRTHLQDATPIMLGDVVGAWVAQLDHASARIATSRARPVRAAPRRHGRRVGAECSPRVRRARHRRARHGHRPAAQAGQQSARRARLARRDGGGQRARCARWPDRSSRSPTTSGSTRRDRAAGSAS